MFGKVPMLSFLTHLDLSRTVPLYLWCNELYNRGEYGDDVVIALIDSGVYYDHEVYGGTLGEGAVVGGLNFYDDPQNPNTNISDCNGHGTFTSSLIVANSMSMLGVSPRAKIKMYNVFGCQSRTPNDIIISVMIKAFEDKSDIISVSIGSNGGYAYSPLCLVGASIAKTVPIIFSAGNDGRNGVFTASNGASGDGPLSIGSVEAASLVSWPLKAKSSAGDMFNFTFVSNWGTKDYTSGSYEADLASNICFTDNYASSSNRVLLECCCTSTISSCDL